MIPVIQTKVVIRNAKGEEVVNGNCFAAAIASMLEVPITEVPNVEVFFPFKGSYWFEVMDTFLKFKGYDLVHDPRFKVFHSKRHGLKENKRSQWEKECKDKYYLVQGLSLRGVYHVCIYKNGQLVHDPYPTKEGLKTKETFQVLEKITSSK